MPARVDGAGDFAWRLWRVVAGLPRTELIHDFLKQPAELIQCDRFHQTKIEAGPYHLLSVLIVCETGDRDQDCLFAGDRLPKSSCQLKPVHLRHDEIGKNQVRLDRVHFLENVAPRRESMNLVTEPLEELARRFAKIRFIIHYDDFQSHDAARFLPAWLHAPRGRL